MVSIKNVAKKAGVGIATVSRVINNSGYVKKETRERVEAVIKELGYVPNEIARSMIAQKTKTVAVIVPTSQQLFFGRLLHDIEQELSKDDYKIMLCNSSESLDKELKYLDMLKNNRVDAVIMSTHNKIESHLDKRKALISIDRKFEGVPFITSDNFHGGELAAEELVQAGCKNLMYIGDDASGYQSPIITEVMKRRIGFCETLKKYGCENVIDIEYPFDDYEVEEQMIQKHLAKHPEVDGIFCMSDVVGSIVVRELRKLGRKVPEDVKVVGFDGSTTVLNTGLCLTTIGQSTKDIAQGIRKMVAKYAKKEIVPNIVVPVRLIKGETT